MCGIVGFLGLPNNTCDIRNIKYLIHMNEHRGKDATGIWDPIYGVQKTLDKAEDFILDGKINWINSNVVIGHCRSASSGAAKSLEGAHPHEFSNVVGVHNGTLRDCYDLHKAYGNGKFHKLNSEVEEIDYYNKYTDSQLLYLIINNTGTTKVLSHIEGSAALLFHDKNKPNVLYAYRKESSGLDERPLYYGLSSEPNHSGIYFSSTDKSLKIIGCTDIKEVKPGHISIFENGELRDSIIINVKKKQQANTSNYYGNYYNNSYYNSYYDNNTNVKQFDASIFENRWFQSKKDSQWLRYSGTKVNGITNANFQLYTCVDLDNKTVNIYSTEFPEYPAVFGANTFVVFTTDIVDSKDNTLYLFLKGQVSKIKELNYQSKKVTVSSFDGDREILFKYIRPANIDESRLYHVNPLFKDFTEDQVIDLIYKKTIDSRKNEETDEEETKNDNERFLLINQLKSPLAVACLLDDEVCSDINHDYEIIKQLDEIISNDDTSIEYKLNDLFVCIDDKMDKDKSKSILLDILVAIKILI